MLRRTRPTPSDPGRAGARPGAARARHPSAARRHDPAGRGVGRHPRDHVRESVLVLGRASERSTSRAGSPSPAAARASASIRSTISNEPREVEHAVALDLLEREAVLEHEHASAGPRRGSTPKPVGGASRGPGVVGPMQRPRLDRADARAPAPRASTAASSASSTPSPQCSGSSMRSNSRVADLVLVRRS